MFRLGKKIVLIIFYENFKKFIIKNIIKRYFI